MVVCREILQREAGWDPGLKVPGDAQPCTGGSNPVPREAGPSWESQMGVTLTHRLGGKRLW